MTFWIITGALSLSVVIGLIFPLLRKPRNEVSQKNFDAAIYKDQLSELDNDVQNGLVSERDERAARTEIQRRLIKSDAVARNENTPGISSRIRWAAILVILVAIPSGAYGLYIQLGIPGMSDYPLADRGDEIRYSEELTSMADMVDGLVEKLRIDPDNPEGWALLGRTYMTLEQYKESMDAYGRAYELAPYSIALAAQYAEARVFAGSGGIDQTARKLFELVLKENPDDFKVRYYIALDLTDKKSDLPRAIAFWEELISETEADAPWLDNLNMNHQRAKESMQGKTG